MNSNFNDLSFGETVTALQKEGAVIVNHNSTYKPNMVCVVDNFRYSEVKKLNTFLDFTTSLKNLRPKVYLLTS